MGIACTLHSHYSPSIILSAIGYGSLVQRQTCCVSKFLILMRTAFYAFVLSRVFSLCLIPKYYHFKSNDFQYYKRMGFWWPIVSHVGGLCPSAQKFFRFSLPKCYQQTENWGPRVHGDDAAL